MPYRQLNDVYFPLNHQTDPLYKQKLLPTIEPVRKPTQHLREPKKSIIDALWDDVHRENCVAVSFDVEKVSSSYEYYLNMALVYRDKLRGEYTRQNQNPLNDLNEGSLIRANKFFGSSSTSEVFTGSDYRQGGLNTAVKFWKQNINKPEEVIRDKDSSMKPANESYYNGEFYGSSFDSSRASLSNRTHKWLPFTLSVDFAINSNKSYLCGVPASGIYWGVGIEVGGIPQPLENLTISNPQIILTNKQFSKTSAERYPHNTGYGDLSFYKVGHFYRDQKENGTPFQAKDKRSLIERVTRTTNLTGNVIGPGAYKNTPVLVQVSQTNKTLVANKNWIPVTTGNNKFVKYQPYYRNWLETDNFRQPQGSDKNTYIKDTRYRILLPSSDGLVTTSGEFHLINPGYYFVNTPHFSTGMTKSVDKIYMYATGSIHLDHAFFKYMHNGGYQYGLGFSVDMSLLPEQTDLVVNRNIQSSQIPDVNIVGVKQSRLSGNINWIRKWFLLIPGYLAKGQIIRFNLNENRVYLEDPKNRPFLIADSLYPTGYVNTIDAFLQEIGEISQNFSFRKFPYFHGAVHRRDPRMQSVHFGQLRFSFLSNFKAVLYDAVFDGRHTVTVQSKQAVLESTDKYVNTSGTVSYGQGIALSRHLTEYLTFTAKPFQPLSTANINNTGYGDRLVMASAFTRICAPWKLNRYWTVPYSTHVNGYWSLSHIQRINYFDESSLIITPHAITERSSHLKPHLDPETGNGELNKALMPLAITDYFSWMDEETTTNIMKNIPFHRDGHLRNMFVRDNKGIYVVPASERSRVFIEKSLRDEIRYRCLGSVLVIIDPERFNVNGSGFFDVMHEEWFNDHNSNEFHVYNRMKKSPFVLYVTAHEQHFIEYNVRTRSFGDSFSDAFVTLVGRLPPNVERYIFYLLGSSYANTIKGFGVNSASFSSYTNMTSGNHTLKYTSDRSSSVKQKVISKTANPTPLLFDKLYDNTTSPYYYYGSHDERMLIDVHTAYTTNSRDIFLPMVQDGAFAMIPYSHNEISWDDILPPHPLYPVYVDYGQDNATRDSFIPWGVSIPDLNAMRWDNGTNSIQFTDRFNGNRKTPLKNVMLNQEGNPLDHPFMFGYLPEGNLSATHKPYITVYGYTHDNQWGAYDLIFEETTSMVFGKWNKGLRIRDHIVTNKTFENLKAEGKIRMDGTKVLKQTLRWKRDEYDTKSEYHNHIQSDDYVYNNRRMMDFWNDTKMFPFLTDVDVDLLNDNADIVKTLSSRPTKVEGGEDIPFKRWKWNNSIGVEFATTNMEQKFLKTHVYRHVYFHDVKVIDDQETSAGWKERTVEITFGNVEPSQKDMNFNIHSRIGYKYAEGNTNLNQHTTINNTTKRRYDPETKRLVIEIKLRYFPNKLNNEVVLVHHGKSSWYETNTPESEPIDALIMVYFDQNRLPSGFHNESFYTIPIKLKRVWTEWRDDEFQIHNVPKNYHEMSFTIQSNSKHTFDVQWNSLQSSDYRIITYEDTDTVSICINKAYWLRQFMSYARKDHFWGLTDAYTEVSQVDSRDSVGINEYGIRINVSFRNMNTSIVDYIYLKLSKPR